MRRAAGLLTLVLGACAREPLTDWIDDPDAHDRSHADASRDAATRAADAAGAADDVPPEATVGPDSSDTSGPESDVGSPDFGGPDHGTIDAFDVGRPSDVRISDRCGSLYRAAIPAAMKAMGADDGGDADVTDARVDVADARQGDRRVDADARDATFDEVCFALEAEFGAFVQQNNACSDTVGCMVVVGVHDCSCYSRGIGKGSGSAVSVLVSAEAENYIARWRAAGCELWRTGCWQDARPSDRAECIQGKCAANQPGCLFPPRPEPAPEPCQ